MDDLGSVANVVDSTGAVKNSYRYDPFGNSTSKTEAVSNPWQFASGYLDANTRLYKFGERYYDPQVGRWTQKDPVGGSLGSVNSTNPYVYANNLPNMVVDPSGRDPFECALGIVATLFLTLPSYIGLMAVISPFIGYLIANFSVVGTGLFAGTLGFGPIIGIALGLAAIFTIGFLAATTLAILPCFR